MPRFRVIAECYDKRRRLFAPPVTRALAYSLEDAKRAARDLANTEDERSRIVVTDDDYRVLEVLR